MIAEIKSPGPQPEDNSAGKMDMESSEQTTLSGAGESSEPSIHTPNPVSPTTAKSSVSEVMDMARSRFEKFWGGKEDPAEDEGLV